MGACTEYKLPLCPFGLVTMTFTEPEGFGPALQQ